MDDFEIDVGRRFLWGCLPILMAMTFVKWIMNKKDGRHKNSSRDQK